MLKNSPKKNSPKKIRQKIVKKNCQNNWSKELIRRIRQKISSKKFVKKIHEGDYEWEKSTSDIGRQT